MALSEALLGKAILTVDISSRYIWRCCCSIAMTFLGLAQDLSHQQR